VNTAVAKGATVISNSYGANEFSGETTYDPYYTHAGIPVTASTGDSGYGVEYPAASPNVTAVGGTNLTPASNGRGWTEKAWGGAGYAYNHTGSLFDVTTGNNGRCRRVPSLLCTAGSGWDGPTGLGTPNGVGAFKSGTGTTSVTVANAGSKTGTVGTAVTLQLSASGGTSPYTWTATGLPTGLSISSSGLISGT